MCSHLTTASHRRYTGTKFARDAAADTLDWNLGCPHMNDDWCATCVRVAYYVPKVTKRLALNRIQTHTATSATPWTWCEQLAILRWSCPHEVIGAADHLTDAAPPPPVEDETPPLPTLLRDASEIQPPHQFVATTRGLRAPPATILAA